MVSWHQCHIESWTGMKRMRFNTRGKQTWSSNVSVNNFLTHAGSVQWCQEVPLLHASMKNVRSKKGYHWKLFKFFKLVEGNVIIESWLMVGMTITHSKDSTHSIWHAPYQGPKLNALGPSDAIWRCRSGSKLAQVMACCLTAPSHYLNQCWIIISKVHWHSYEGNSTLNALAINH